MTFYTSPPRHQKKKKKSFKAQGDTRTSLSIIFIKLMHMDVGPPAPLQPQQFSPEDPSPRSLQDGTCLLVGSSGSASRGQGWEVNVELAASSCKNFASFRYIRYTEIYKSPVHVASKIIPTVTFSVLFLLPIHFISAFSILKRSIRSTALRLQDI